MADDELGVAEEDEGEEKNEEGTTGDELDRERENPEGKTGGEVTSGEEDDGVWF